MSPRPKVLVAEKIGDSGVNLLQEHFDVDLGVGWDRDELAQKIGGYDGILIRSATKLDAEMLEHATNLKAVGRAGVGVDNVDVPVATKRGIIVANAPQSNVVTAAEHTMALLLAMARNVPQAHGALKEGRWDRSKYSGVELMDKTLGILGFGRIGQLVAQRAQGFGMRVLAYDPFVGAEKYRDLGVEKADSSEDVYAQADFITVHLPKTPRPRAGSTRGVRPDEGRRASSTSPAAAHRRGGRGRAHVGQGRRRRADVFSSEPMTESPLFAFPNVSSPRTWAPRPPRPPIARGTRLPSRWWPPSPAAP